MSKCLEDELFDIYEKDNTIIASLKEIYEKGRADAFNEIGNMILLGCEELKCDECDYRLYPQDVCQQAYTSGVIENYIAEKLKEQK